MFPQDGCHPGHLIDSSSNMLSLLPVPPRLRGTAWWSPLSFRVEKMAQTSDEAVLRLIDSQMHKLRDPHGPFRTLPAKL
jgi:hypothetical protein